MYSRNYIYISQAEQVQIADFRILIAGVGLGSNIAECAVRLGFQNFILIDGDTVEASNLNRQNYTSKDIGKSKVLALKKRLLQINPHINISTHNIFLTEDNIAKYIHDCDVVINTIDFTSNAPFILSHFCKTKNIPSIHPYNLGWAGCIFVVTKESKDISEIPYSSVENFEINIVQHIIEQQEHKGINCDLLKLALREYNKNYKTQSPPQLAIASYFVAAGGSDILFKLATKQEVILFPETYFINSI